DPLLVLDRLDIDDVARRENVGDLVDSAALAPARRPRRPLHLGDGQRPGLALVGELPAHGAPRLQANRGGIALRAEHDSEVPVADIRQGRNLAERPAPVTADVDMIDRAAPAERHVVLLQAVPERLLRLDLQLWIKRGA